MAVTRYEVKRNVWRNLYYAGIDVPHAKMGMFSPRRAAARRDEEREDIDFLHGITLLALLTTEELDEIAQKMRRHICIAGQPVVREGEEGDSLFVVKKGTLEVSITGESGISTVVGWLNPEMFIGEMSLLTGVPRSATVRPSDDSVVFVITRSDLESLIMRRPTMSDQLSEVPAERQPRNMRLLDEEKGAGALETLTSLLWQFLGGIQMYCMMAVSLILTAVWWLRMPNTEWRGTRKQWRNRIEHWLDRARPEDLLSVDIFFDLRPVAGDRSLGDGLLADAIIDASRSKPFLGLMAQSLAKLAPSFSLFHRPWLEEGGQDLRRDALLPIVCFTRAMVLRIGLTARAMADRIRVVTAAGKIGGGNAVKLI